MHGHSTFTHPLIREYFGEQLKNGNPQAWKEAHSRLYEYYKALPKKQFPDTLEEMVWRMDVWREDIRKRWMMFIRRRGITGGMGMWRSWVNYVSKSGEQIAKVSKTGMTSN